MRVVVTGGAGFIGSHLVDRLMSDGHEVTVIDDLSSGNLNNLSRWLDNPRFRFLKADLSIRGEWEKGFEGAEVVYHLAANPEVRVSSTAPEIHYRSNVQATFNVLEASRIMDVKLVVFASSSTVYGEAKVLPTPEEYYPLEPISVYGASKLASEVFLGTYSRLYNIRGVSLRLANVVGPRSTHGVIFDFVNKLSRNPKELEILGDGSQRKSYIHVSDVIEATVKVTEYMLRTGTRYEVFNIGSEDSVTVVEIADLVVEAMGLKDVKYVFKPMTVDGRGWPGDVKTMLLDISKIKKLTGWNPRYNSREAIRETLKWFLAR